MYFPSFSYVCTVFAMNRKAGEASNHMPPIHRITKIGTYSDDVYSEDVCSVSGMLILDVPQRK